jgi:pimeloyl-ACP methyl ester carboxylesterase
VLHHVEAPDGARIACEVGGDGPPLVLVHGAGSARWSFDALRPELERSFRVTAIDRRGRGDSTDGPEYELEREFDDVAAVVRDAGPDARLVGHSYGGLVASGAARLLDLPGLALYEPPMGGVLATRELIERWERLIAEGERDTVVREFFREIAGYDEDAIREAESSPVWAARTEIVPTVPRELRAEQAHRLEPDALAEIAAPTLMLVGSESPDWAVRSVEAYTSAMPGAERVVLEGQGHAATMTAPGLLAAELERFLS